MVRTTVLPALLVLAVACDDTRRPGGNTPPSTRRDAAVTDGAEATDGGPADAADPTADAAPIADADPARDGAPARDADPAPDALGFLDAQVALDAMAAPDAQLAPDAQVAPDGGAGMPSAASAALAAARALPNGPAGIVVDGAVVTWVRTQALGNDLPGFAVQAEQAGPALWIAVDPNTLSPPPAVGDRARFTIDTVGSNTTTMRLASAISGYQRLQSGVNLAPLVQDVTNTTDLVSNLAGYELELVRASATIASGFRGAGSYFQSARVETPGVAGDPNFELRLPTAVNEALGLGFGCAFTVTNPLWRFEVRPQLQAFAANELTNLTCPAGRLVTASAPSDARVILTFDRPVSAASINPSGAQFTFTGGLRALAARVAGGNVIVTTSAQQALTSYTVSVAGTVSDARGNAIDAAFRTANFSGAAAGARAVINEVNANIAGGCDLVELRVVRGGSLDGWSLRSRDIVMATFGPLVVATNQVVVVHAAGGSPTCNPGMISGGELSSPTELPRATFGTNFDTAFDWFSTQGGVVNTDTVLTLLDGGGNVVDAVLLSDDPTGPTANASEDAALLVAGVGEWVTAAGTIPPGGFVDDSFCAAAVSGLNATATDAFGPSLSRASNADNNNAADWVTASGSSWGSLNPGQSPL